MKAKPKNRNFVAKAVRTPQFRIRIVENAKAYNRKKQPKLFLV